MPETKRRLKVSPSLVISIFALVIAMSAGAYAATIAPKNSVVSKSIKNKNVKSADIKPGAVKVKQLGGNAVDTSKIADGTVGSADIGDGQVGLDDLATTAKTDLNDAATLGGLTVAQIVAASGGEYIESKQAAGDVDIETVTPQTLVTLNLPHAGKYLVNARVPVDCVYDGSDGATPADPSPNQPWILARGTLSVGAAVVENVEASCEAEGGQLIFLVGIWRGTAMVDITRMVTVTGPTTLTLKGFATSSVLLSEFPAASRINANASGSMIQAITVQ
jgi:hypothetical protein